MRALGYSTDTMLLKLKIVDAGIEEADTVLRIMRLSFEEYRGKLYPESGALRESLEDVHPVHM